MSVVRPRGLALVERPAAIEASLWRRLRFEAQSQCRETLFMRHLPLARSIAKREYRRRPAYGLEQSDFEQLAIHGLLEALDNFDPIQGAPFTAYARHRIRGAITDGVSRSSESAAQYTYRRKLQQERLSSLRSDEDPTDDPIAALADLAIGLAIGLIAEDAHVSHAGGYDGTAWRDLEAAVPAAIAGLSGAERSIMELHYYQGVQFSEIAALLGLSKGRISQVHRAAIAKVRARVRAID